MATAVTKGDLTRSIQVEAQGEVASLKDNINEMIRNLKDTTLKNSEQDWLKTNLAKFSRMLQGQKDLLTVGRLILSELAPVVGAQQGVFYIIEPQKDELFRTETSLTKLASYAHSGGLADAVPFGHGLIGQCAVEKEKILVTNIPSDYVRISSGLGEAAPRNIIVLPVLFEEQIKGVIELASFERFSPTHEVFLDQLMESIGIVLNTIEANMRTEDLLKQSQSLTNELQKQQDELQKTNKELKEKASLLAQQNVEVERKNAEVEHARKALEEKAEQLALTSKYKSEFLANMSHELRTPLNSLLILSDHLTRNETGNLIPKQIEFCKTIHDSGNDLLALINDILDLSKIESGTVSVDISELPLGDLTEYVERNFRHVAQSKGLDFKVVLDQSLPRIMSTDSKRLQQILKNLLSNAFKFTAQGNVSVQIEPAAKGWNPENEALNNAKSVIAFSVTDTGIGIHPDKQQIIFEAFQQEDGSTSRRYGGTGLGLAISREISRMLGGEIALESTPGQGSKFTLYLPRSYHAPKAVRKPAHVATVQRPADEPSARPAIEITDNQALAAGAAIPIPVVEDDRERVSPNDDVLLLVDNDTGFTRFLLDLAHRAGFKGLIAASGSEALSLAGAHSVKAVLLDIRLPTSMDGRCCLI